MNNYYYEAMYETGPMDFILPGLGFIWYFICKEYIFKSVLEGEKSNFQIVAMVITYLPVIVLCIFLMYLFVHMWMFWIIPALGWAYDYCRKHFKK